MYMRIQIFGYELIFRKEYFTKFNITDYVSEPIQEGIYVHDFNMDKRIRVLVGHHGMVEYIFRDLAFAIITYDEYAIQLLEDVIKTLSTIRTKIKSKGATDSQLNEYDDKVYTCYRHMLTSLHTSGFIEPKLLNYDIINYYL